MFQQNDFRNLQHCMGIENASKANKIMPGHRTLLGETAETMWTAEFTKMLWFLQCVPSSFVGLLFFFLLYYLQRLLDVRPERVNMWPNSI